MADYEETYDEFWKEIVENPDGSLNVDQVKRELHDFAAVMDEVSKAYDELTGSRISKPNASASAVISAAHECSEAWLDDRLVEWTKDIIDVFENVDGDATPAEIREQLFDVLGIREEAV